MMPAHRDAHPSSKHWPSVQRREWRLVGWTCLAVLVLVGAPYLVMWLLTPPGHIATGLHSVASGDIAVYYNYIDQARDGAWRFTDPFTSEPHAPFNLNVYWVGVGWLAKLTATSAPVAFHLARVLAVPFFLAVLYWFVSVVFWDVRRRRAGFLLATFASGVGWLAFIAFPQAASGDGVFGTYPMDLWVTEGFPFLNFYQTGHFTFGTTLMLIVLGGALLAWRSGQVRYSLAAGSAALLLFAFHPFHALPLGMVLVTLGLVEVIHGVPARRIMLHLALIAGLATPTFVAQTLLLTNEIARGRAEQNILLTPGFWNLAVSYGLLLVGGALALCRRATWQRRALTVLAVWAIVHGLTLYAPVFFQRRLTQGWSIPLALLTADLLVVAADRVRRRFGAAGQFLTTNRAVLTLGFIAGFFLSNFFLITYDLRLAINGGGKTFAMYLPAEYRRAHEVLADAPGASVVVGSVWTSNLVTGFTGQRSFVAHPVETVDFSRKYRLMERFFQDLDPPEEQERFLASERITHVIWGEAERAFGSFNPAEKAFLEPMFETAVVSVYRVRSAFITTGAPTVSMVR